MTSIPADLRKQLDDVSQAHLLKFWDELVDAERQLLLSQIASTDLKTLQQIWQTSNSDNSPHDTTKRIESARMPDKVINQPQATAEFDQWKQAASIGERELQAGRVAVITVAGGQGSRLGFEHPKGMFSIGPISDRTLFQIFAEQILARRKRHHAAIPWLIMTSAATHAETVCFLQQQDYFQLGQETVHLFQQGSMPALDAATGRILMTSRSELALSPDGHGGLVAALASAGLLEIMSREGIQHLFYHQVDNPTAILCDPAFVGFHSLQGSQLSTNVVRKVSPTERMGVLVSINGRTEIVEYSELTPEQSARCDAKGNWIFWAGNTAIQIIDREFMEQLATDVGQLPLHIARKNVPFMDDNGATIQPDDPAQPNAIKLERFIFDALPIAKRTLIVEGDRAREFNPVKNRDGADSPETCRAALSRIGREWLATAGHPVADDRHVEISPLQALDAQELAQKIASQSIRVSDLL